VYGEDTKFCFSNNSYTVHYLRGNCSLILTYQNQNSNEYCFEVLNFVICVPTKNMNDMMNIYNNEFEIIIKAIF